MLDKPYRKAVVAVFRRDDQKVLLGKRSDTGTWQFPQGGVDSGETAKEALFREMQEEIGCNSFVVVKESKSEISYDFPSWLKINVARKYKGQRQTWYLCCLEKGQHPDLEKASCDEFIELAWFEPKFALATIVEWKKQSYQKGLEELGLL